MAFATISKAGTAAAKSARLTDYGLACRAYSWAVAQRELTHLPDGGLNIAFEAVDRHAEAGKGTRLALRWLGKDDSIRDFTYADLRDATNRFANVLKRLAVQPGETVFTAIVTSAMSKNV